MHSRDNRGAFQVSYVAKVRLPVRANGETIVREGFGTGESQASSPGAAHEMALKGAETDATKRALVTFGRCFGLRLYANGHRAGRAVQPPKEKAEPAKATTTGSTPLPRTTSLKSPRKRILAQCIS